jgi:hypothetical protein
VDLHPLNVGSLKKRDSKKKNKAELKLAKGSTIKYLYDEDVD